MALVVQKYGGSSVASAAHIKRVAERLETPSDDLTQVLGDLLARVEIEALRRAVTQQFDQYVKLNKKIPPEILTSISSIDDPGRLADTIAAHLPIKIEQKQGILETTEVGERLVLTTLSEAYRPGGAFPEPAETPWTHGGPPSPEPHQE